MIYKIISLEKEEIENNRYALDIDDQCFYYMTYDPQSDLFENKEKQIIINLKISNQNIKENSKRKYHKEQSIIKIGQWLISTIKKHSSLLDYLWIPAAPSKSISDENYDDRLLKILTIVKNEIPKFIFFDAFFVKRSIMESHKSNERDVQKKLDNLGLDAEFIDKLKSKKIVVFDDVLTTGSTFKASKQKLLEIDSALKVIGIFIAKTVSQ